MLTLYLLCHLPGLTPMQRPGQHVCHLPEHSEVGTLWRCECGRRWRCWSIDYEGCGDLWGPGPHWRRYRWPWPRTP